MLTLAIFSVLVGLVLLGVPIFAAMGLTAVGVFALAGEIAILPLMAQRMYVATTGFTLLAIPFFILAGNLMNYGGITQRVFDFARALVGHIRGGLGHVNVVASMIFSGMSGAAVADAAGLGVVEMKAMTENGYDREFSAAITAASSTIGPVIPPSIPFVVYGSMAGVSIVKLFMAGFVPGVLMGLALMIAVYFIAKKRGYPVDPWPSLRHLWKTFMGSALALLMPVIIIGGILGGLFTPTEAAVVASLYAFVVGGVIYREFGIKDIPEIIWESVKQSVRVLFIIATADFFSWVMIHQSIPEKVILGLTTITSEPWIILLIIIFILLVLGCFMEGIAVLVITIPVFMPLIERFGIDPVQFGVVMILCSMIGLLTPPVGMSLYAVATISGVSIGRLSTEVWPYLLGIFIVTLMISFIPELSLWLPNLLMPK
ncbi:TRAP transporter large permease [Shumkonia mesophila]|uniref:TRAP transporter large permease n=1 Tax=Shumkonia mesophila TaxID=2838854 RepID=UPI00293424B5|nr:TRAP transporter large permease [Shumkonia mesophila]